jgi:hypothetical protein
MKNCKYAIAVLSLGLLFTASASAEVGPPEVSDSLRNDISPPVGAQVFRAAPARPVEEREGPSIRRPKLDQLVNAATSGPVRAAPAAPAPFASALNVSLGVNVLGVGVGFPNYFVPDAPTDVNLAVGDTQVVQWVNVSFAVFDKATGRALTGPIDGNALWSGFGGRCETHNDGDIIAQWDKLAHRWVLTQNVFGLPYLTCIAISTTPDATGSYFRYVFANNAGLPDYPKWGLQADAYFQTQNAFAFSPAGARYLGAHVCAFDRANMLAGRKASQICFTTGTFDDSMLPADLDSATAAAPRQAASGVDDDDGDGRTTQPEVLLGSIDNFDPSNSNTVFMYLFHPNFRNPRKSTFKGAGGTMPITVAPFALACGGFGSCIEQPSDPNFFIPPLDSLGDRLMYRLAYRNFGDHQSWVVNHSVDVGSSVGERWYEFRAPARSTNLTVFQQGTFAPDSTFRWMGSIAQDKAGNIALGYSASSRRLFPSIFISGRSAGDALGTLAPEVAITLGTGSQVDTVSRWGDYTSMALDAADDCTFWYTNQYYTLTDSFAWSTRVASFKFNNCR